MLTCKKEMRIATKIFLPLLVALAALAQVPRPSPDYSFKLIDGKDVKVNDYRGKVVVLAFMSTT
jgi:hypothetical protein